MQVHTPASILNNGFGSDWDIYVKNLFKSLIDKGIAAVGVTDYFTISGYKKIKEDYLADDAKLKALFSNEEIEKIKKILVIPNVEFRSDIFVGQNSVNFHVIFSDSVQIKDIEEKFLHEIDFVYQGEPQSEDKKRKLKEINLTELGAQLKQEHSEFQSHTDLYVGMMNAVVDHKQISKILADKESIFGGKYLFVTVADEDLSAIGWDSRDHLTRKVLIQKADLLFSSNKNTRNWGLGKPPFNGGIKKFISEFKTLKPCVHGSDAHELKFIGYPCAKRGIQTHDCLKEPDKCDLRFCWIKADPTFEGLKQILYEPEERIVIQQTNPTPVKSLQTIYSFYIKEALLEPELKLKRTGLLINRGLVAVTGGKGSGKTALVDLIANIYEDRAFCDDKNSFVKRITDSFEPQGLRTAIKLHSGQEHNKEVKESSFIEGASIVYVAQGELEKHVEDPAHLETYINNLIFESNEIKDSELLFDYQNINDEVLNINDEVEKKNKSIFILENETDFTIEDDFKKVIKKLNADLNDTNIKIEDFIKSSSPEKIKSAEEKQKQLTELRDRKLLLNDLGANLKAILDSSYKNIQLFNDEILKVNDLAKKLNFNLQFEIIKYGELENLKSFIATIRVELRKTIGEIEKFQKDLEEKEKGIKEHAKLLDKKKEIERSIKKTEENLKIIEEKKKILVKEIESRNNLFRSLLEKRVEQRDKYISIIAAFATNKNDILSDLEFTADLMFDRDRFLETMSELVDLRKIKIKGVTGNDSDIAFFTDAMLDLIAAPTLEKIEDTSHQKIKDLLSKIIPNQKRAETISRLTIYGSIFADYLSVVPSVRYKKVKLSKLSLGQKATVLIKIYLAQGENPIIIDSHDDHLDNEFIMEELVKSLRQAKQYRQVIVVSNNGNVVVNSDAEQVIIACRDNQGEISYLSGSLENPDLRLKLLKVLEGGEEAFSRRQQKYRLN